MGSFLAVFGNPNKGATNCFRAKSIVLRLCFLLSRFRTGNKRHMKFFHL